MRLTLVFFAFLVSCAESSSGEDAGTEPGPDAAAGALCPYVGWACKAAEGCGVEGSPPSNCGPFCPKYNAGMCLSGECSTPAETAVVNLQFEIEQYVIDRAETYVGVALAKKTSGGLVRTCVDGRLAEFSECLNVVDVRKTDRPPTGANGTQLPFRVPVGEPLILHVYGFEATEASGEPIGFSCTEHLAAEANPADPDIPGDRMKQIQ
ncbi:MAG: hypothetical protein HYV07_24140 [Deltaproteobacteria bacterium]|nr:hypothetical protein [Deltaproteobacteria bacterium]